MKALHAETQRRQVAELAALDAEIDTMGEHINQYGHAMSVAVFNSLQRRYWAARERRAYLTGIPLLGL